ncbi:hypothetical protein GW796_05665 [archaeon]|nr:hypothetical protein [archaeon]NCQ51371.1 hypothetical protein [archaeon]NCT58803.1 hypothetical protein [archaeon]
MKWSDVGDWVKENAGAGVGLVGSLLTGNIPGAIAAGVSMVSSATGSDDPDKALSILQSNPEATLKLKELYFKNEDSIRSHLEQMTKLDLEDKQKEHEQTQLTIRNADNATDEYVRRTRPKMAKQSFWLGSLYCCIMELGNSISFFDSNNIEHQLLSSGANWEIATLLFSGAFAYMGLRTMDKIKGKNSIIK